MTPADVRAHLVDALRLDLIGPAVDDLTHAQEVLSTAPSQWYLGGFLVPFEAPDSQRGGEDTGEQLDLMERPGAGDDEDTPETASARRGFFPSSLGLSFLCPADAPPLDVTITWGDYQPLGKEEKDGDAAADGTAEPRASRRSQWQRIPRAAALQVTLQEGPPRTLEVPDSGCLQLVASVRRVPPGSSVPAGALAVSLFLVNNRQPSPDSARDQGYIFQAVLTARCAAGFIPRPDVSCQDGDEWDGKVADLQYRDEVEYVVGHNVAATAHTDAQGRCCEVRTTWVPAAEVEKVVPGRVKDVELSMEVLAQAASGEQVRGMLSGLLTHYEKWIRQQVLPEDSRRAAVGRELLRDAENARQRIQAGLQALDSPEVLLAFRLANRAIATALRQRACHGTDKSPASVEAPRWYPFQLAFLLMNLNGLAQPTHGDRKIVDLLFFPTGGGKTEAYLGLAAFTLLLRRLRHPGLGACGVSVLMRYTLRLLTLDQLGRAATLICALEQLRQADPAQLGPWPFEIGLWVGQTATPNRMGKKGDSDEYTARSRTIAYQNDDKRKPAPIPIENCPWCGTKFNPNSFLLLPTPDAPLDLRVRCVSRRCAFNGASESAMLPILAVDEPIYRRLPCFLIATVDKFAALPWVGQTGALFGRVERHDKDGFYGPADPGQGRPLGGRLPPPDLVIQDELHLISGPLGTMAGLYETAIDALCSTDPELGDGTPRPKIVASTATVRRASSQIRALFGREEVEIFPPPGPDRRDSFFACTVPSSERHPRLYVGVASQGRSLKVVLLRTYLALMAAAQKHWQAAGGASNPQNPADPYMTLLGYFNSLRELGGSRRIVEDEVNHRLGGYGSRRRVGEKEGVFARRQIDDLPQELTSRVSTNQVADTKRRLALPFHETERVDVALATNMISVGLDITRLGLMVVLGQPKTASEYIQATSRVGRSDEKPGLVVTLLNVHRPRDRSHYERFCAWHRTFYRSVETTSVTPFSPRAIDRGLAGVTVALARHGLRELTAPPRAVAITAHRRPLAFVADVLGRRAERHQEMTAAEAEALRQKLKGRVNDLLDVWESIAHEKSSTGSGLQYQRETGGDPPLLRQPTDPELLKLPLPARKFKAARSLRDVEPSVNLWVRNPDGFMVEEESK
ncbi:MAG TPA: DISARM system helicase DrmA [Pseudomonadota bacterium]|nr:DISARM system helicase DrmA [Pseudomonadota bacterium]